MIFTDRCPRSTIWLAKEAAMRRDDIMQAELASELVLLTTGILVIAILIGAVLVAFARVASLLP